MKKIRATAALVAISLAPWALAQAPAAQPAPQTQSSAASAVVPSNQQATREQLAKLFEVMRMRQQITQLMGMMSSAMEQSVQQGMEEAMAQVPSAQQLTSGQQTQLNGIMNKYMKKATSIYTADEMIEDATAVYQRHMSRSDVDAYIAFYSSPAGQRFLDAQPVIMKEFMPIVMNKSQERSKALDSEMLKDITNFVKTQAPPSAPPEAPAK